MTRAVSIGLKIPDNTAYTALVALRRLGVAVERVERNELYLFDDGGDVEALVDRVTSDETIFNPNKHRLSLADGAEPRDGEAWIQPVLSTSRGPAATAWRLFGENGQPVQRAVLICAIERLLCNPAIDRAIIAGPAARDNPSDSE